MLNAGLCLPLAVMKPDCQPAPMFVSSRSMNQTMMSIRGFLRAIANDWRTYAACRAYETPKMRSGGVCHPYLEPTRSSSRFEGSFEGSRDPRG